MAKMCPGEFHAEGSFGMAFCPGRMDTLGILQAEHYPVSHAA